MLLLRLASRCLTSSNWLSSTGARSYWCAAAASDSRPRPAEGWRWTNQRVALQLAPLGKQDSRGFQTSEPRCLKIKMGTPSSRLMRSKDGVDKGFNIIYRGSSENYVKAMLAGLQFMPVLAVYNIWYILYNQALPAYELTDAFGLAWMFGGAYVLAKFVYSYPLRIYYNPGEDEYAVIFVGKTPFSTSLLSVKPGGLKRPLQDVYSRRFRPWHKITYYHDKKRIFLLEVNFIVPEHFEKLGGSTEVYPPMRGPGM